MILEKLSDEKIKNFDKIKEKIKKDKKLMGTYKTQEDEIYTKKGYKISILKEFMEIPKIFDKDNAKPVDEKQANVWIYHSKKGAYRIFDISDKEVENAVKYLKDYFNTMENVDNKLISLYQIADELENEGYENTAKELRTDIDNILKTDTLEEKKEKIFDLYKYKDILEEEGYEFLADSMNVSLDGIKKEFIINNLNQNQKNANNNTQKLKH
jgi:hypothetical protein